MTGDKVNRAFFNYGRALGKPPKTQSGPNAHDAGSEYRAIAAYAHALGEVAVAMSAGAWAVEMGLKHVRDACTAEEQAAALQALRREFHRVDRELEHVARGPLKFFRYGRIGNILRGFASPLLKG